MNKPKSKIKINAGKWNILEMAYIKVIRMMIGINFIWCFILCKNKASANVDIKETANIISNSKIKWRTEDEPKLSFSVIKLKKMTPKISDKLLS